MKIISWYIRGLGSRRKRLVLKEQLVWLRPEIVILQETKKQAIDRRLGLCAFNRQVWWYCDYLEYSVYLGI